jgi:Saxitoxin biosynthesis operon protein SxtJ
MSLIEFNRNPSRKDLAWFGLILLVLLAWIGLLAGRATHSPAVARAIWGLGIVAFVLYYAVPPLRKPMFVGWMYVTYPIGYVISHVLLGAIYFGLFTPAGWLLRLFGHDPMYRTFDRDASTHWVEREKREGPTSYFRQY